jgi:hypothetical protein
MHMINATCLEQASGVIPGAGEHAEVDVAETYSLEMGKVELFHLLRLVLIELKSPALGLSYRHRLHVFAEKMKALARRQ